MAEDLADADGDALARTGGGRPADLGSTGRRCRTPSTPLTPRPCSCGAISTASSDAAASTGGRPPPGPDRARHGGRGPYAHAGDARRLRRHRPPPPPAGTEDPRAAIAGGLVATAPSLEENRPTAPDRGRHRALRRRCEGHARSGRCSTSTTSSGSNPMPSPAAPLGPSPRVCWPRAVRQLVSARHSARSNRWQDLQGPMDVHGGGGP